MKDTSSKIVTIDSIIIEENEIISQWELDSTPVEVSTPSTIFDEYEPQQESQDELPLPAEESEQKNSSSLSHQQGSEMKEDDSNALNDEKLKSKLVRSALSEEWVNLKRIAKKAAALLDAKTINPITGEIVEDNVTQRDMLKFISKDLLGLWSSSRWWSPTLQIFNNNGNSNKYS